MRGCSEAKCAVRNRKEASLSLTLCACVCMCVHLYVSMNVYVGGYYVYVYYVCTQEIFLFCIHSDVYSAIGDCLAAFIEAFPTRILESSEDSLVISVTELTADIERAVLSGSTCSNVEYVVQVVLPLLCRYVHMYVVKEAMLLMYNCMCIFMCCTYVHCCTYSNICSYSPSHIGKYWIVQLDHKLVFRQLLDLVLPS